MPTHKFPNELISEIAKNVELKDLLTVSLLCRRWRGASRRFLFTNVNICNSERLDFFLSLVRQEPVIFQWILHLQLGSPGPHDPLIKRKSPPDWFYPATLALHGRLRNLQSLEIRNTHFSGDKDIVPAFLALASGFKSVKFFSASGCLVASGLLRRLVARLPKLQYLSIENCWDVYVAPVGETWDAELGTVTESPKFKMINIERWPEETRRIMTDLRVSGYMRDIKTICIATPLSSMSESWKEIRFLCENVGSRLEELHLKVPQGRSISFLPGEPSPIDLGNNKNLKLLNLDGFPLSVIKETVHTLRCSVMPDIFIRFSTSWRFEDDPDLRRLDDLIAEYERGGKLTIWSETFLPDLLPNFPKLHHKKRVCIGAEKIRRGFPTPFQKL